MQIKRFKAKDMTEALRSIKREFGSEAVILSARNLKEKKKMFGFLSSPGVEVTAAIDAYHSQTGGKNLSNKNGSLQKYQHGPFNNYSRYAMASSASFNQQKSAMKIGADYVTTENQFSQKNTYELFRTRRQMLSHGVNEDIAIELTKKSERMLPTDKLINSDEIISVLDHILSAMGVSSAHITQEPKKRRIVAFVGPTGVGKTTTIAKIAAYNALQAKKGVALITLDNYRIGAVDQFKIYAKIIGAPMEITTNARELKKSLKRFKDKDLILIDTAGISRKNDSQFNETAEFLDKIRDVEIHLLLSATTKDNELDEILKRFSLFKLHGLIFTKLDESTTYGNILNQLCRTKIPATYFTNGQQIPEDIETASLKKLLDLIIQANDKENVVVQPQIFKSNDRRENYISGNYSHEYYVANKNSDVFHYRECKWGKKIKKENLVTFENIDEAMNKGFKPCGLCNPGEIEKQNFFSEVSDKKRIATYGY